MYLIVSCDGGGVRGALTARILERIEAASPFLSRVDMVTGTSIGGINALYLADGRGPTELVKLFKENSANIFADRGCLDSIIPDEIWRSDYTQDKLKSVLTAVFGQKALSQLQRKVLITSLDLDDPTSTPRRWKPKMFHNFEGATSDAAELVVDVALRTSAAPTYFPSYQGFVDGGIAANNPSMCAVAKAVRSGIKLEDIMMISVGTGLNSHYVEGDNLDWGLEDWAPKLFDMLFDAMIGIPDYQCTQLLKGRYVRLNPVLMEEIKLDDISKIDALIKIADQTDITSAVKLLAG